MTIKFPLMLSCGHQALSNCKCRSERGSRRPYVDIPVDRVLREFNGAWRQTLEGYGCHLPSGRQHGPCPVCGGKDRFRFDDKDGRGTWFCSQCDPQSGGGLLLLSRFLGKPTIEVANELLGNTPERSRAPVYRSFVSDDQIRKANHEQARKGAEALLASSELRPHPYMSDRGLDGQWLVSGEPIMGRDRSVIQPGELLLDHLRHAVFQRLCGGASVGGGYFDRRRGNVRVLRNGQRADRQYPGEHDENGDNPGKDRATHEETGKHQAFPPLVFISSAFTSCPAVTLSVPSTISLSPAFKPLSTSHLSP